MDIISPQRGPSTPWTLPWAPKVACLAEVGRRVPRGANQVTLAAARPIYMGRLPVLRGQRLGEDLTLWIQGLPGLPRAAGAPTPAPLMCCVESTRVQSVDQQQQLGTSSSHHQRAGARAHTHPPRCALPC